MPTFSPPVIGASIEIPNAGRGLERFHDQNASGTTNTESYRRTGLEWSYFEGATPGVYDKTKMEAFLTANAARGQRSIVAIATTRGADSYAGAFVPSYLLEKDANGVRKYGAWYKYRDGSNGNEPFLNADGSIGGGFFLDWGNSYVRERWEAFISWLAAQYDGDPRLLALDMTAVGAYGEWYISGSAPSRVFMNTEKRLWVIDTYHKYFKKTPLRMASDDEIALKLCFDKYPKDSWFRMSWGRTEHFAGKLVTKYSSYPTFLDRWKTANAPIGIETYGFNFSIDTQDIQDIRTYHVSLLGDGNFVDVSYANRSQTEKDLFLEAGRTCGYRYVIGTVTAPDPAPGSWLFSMNLENVGVAPTYDNWDVVVQLRSSEYTVLWEGILDNCNLKGLLPEHGSVQYQKTFTLPATIETGYTYRLNIVIRDKNPNLAGLTLDNPKRFVLRNLLPANGGALDDRSIFIGTVGTGTPPPPPPAGNITLHAGNGISADAQNSNTVTIPGSAVDEDEFIVWAINRTPGATVSVTNSGSLTLLKDVISGSTIRGLFYKHTYDTATSPASWTFAYADGTTTSDWQCGILPAAGVDLLVPIDNAGLAIDDEIGGSGSVNLPFAGVTTATANAHLQAIISTAFSFNDITSDSGLMTRLTQYRSSTPNIGITTAIFDELIAVPGATGARAFSYSGARSVGILFALKPAASAPPPVVPVLTIDPELIAYEGSNNDANLFRVFTNLSSTTTNTIEINYKLTATTASLPGDLAISSTTGTWVIQPGKGYEDGTFFALSVVNDLISEPDETFKLEITSVVNATLAGYPSGGWTLTIKDDDQTIAVASFSGYPDAVVSNGAVNDSIIETTGEVITVELDTPLAYNTTLSFTTTPIGWTEGVHYTVSPVGKILTFNQGETQKTITITPTNDGIQNPPRSLTVQLGSGVGITLGSPRIINFVVTDDDAIIIPDPVRPSIPTGYTAFFVQGSGIQHIWHQSTNVSSYDIQWGKGNTNTPEMILTDYTTQPDRYLQDDLYELGQTYFYRLRGKNTVGYSDWTEWIQVDVPGAPPVPPPTTAPVLSGSVENGTVALLMWTPVTNASNYEVQISTNLSDYTSIGIVGTNFRRHTPDTTGGVHTFYYQVRGLNPTGQAGPWSNVQTIEVILQPSGTIAYVTKERIWPAEEYAVQNIIDGVRLAIEDFASVVVSDNEIMLYIREAIRASQKHFVEIERLVYRIPQNGQVELPVTFYVPRDYQKYEPLAVRLSVPGWTQRVYRFEWKRDTLELHGMPVVSDKGYYELLYMTPCEVPTYTSDMVAVPRAWLIAATLVRLLPLYAKRTQTDQTLNIQEQMNRAMSEFQSAVRVPQIHEDGSVR